MDKVSAKPKILVIDDDQDMRIFIATLLKDDGFKPVVADTPEKGLAKAARNQPALIILDIPIPVETGIDLYQTLKQDQVLKHIPVIMISSLDPNTLFQYQSAAKLFKQQKIAMPEAFLKKPLEAEELLALTRKFLPWHSGERRIYRNRPSTAASDRAQD